MDDFDAILNEHKNPPFTLSVYDFLAFQALDFYANSKSSLAKPKNAFLYSVQLETRIFIHDFFLLSSLKF